MKQKTSRKKTNKYPIVGPVKYAKPTPLSGEFEKTGKPIIPSNKYKPTVAKANFISKTYT